MKLQDSTEIINIPSRNIIDENYMVYEKENEAILIILCDIVNFYFSGGNTIN